MAISVQAGVLAWRRVANYLLGLKPSVQRQILTLKSYIAQNLGDIDLQVVPFTNLSDAEVIIADAACKLYAIVLVKPTATATFSKATDSATTSSDAASEIRVWSSRAGNQHCLIYPDGQSFANGITMQGNTTANGGGASGADGCTGFIILGRP